MLVFAKVHVELVREGETEQNSCKEHLNGDEEVLIGSRSVETLKEVKPLEDSQEKTYAD